MSHETVGFTKGNLRDVGQREGGEMSDYPIPEDLKELHEWVQGSGTQCRDDDLIAMIERIARLEAQNNGLIAEAARVREITGITSDGEVQQGESLYGAFLKLRDERDALKSQVASTNTLLRDASEDMAKITEALGPQTHSGSIADAVKALVAKCEWLSAPVSDAEWSTVGRSHWGTKEVNSMLAARAGKVQP